MAQDPQTMINQLKNDTVKDFKDKVTLGPQRRALSGYFDQAKSAENRFEQKVGDWLLPPIQAKDEPAVKSQIKISNQTVAPKQAAAPKDGTKKVVTKRIMTK